MPIRSMSRVIPSSKLRRADRPDAVAVCEREIEREHQPAKGRDHRQSRQP